jgi:hypothetical protein
MNCLATLQPLTFNVVLDNRNLGAFNTDLTSNPTAPPSKIVTCINITGVSTFPHTLTIQVLPSIDLASTSIFALDAFL